MIELPRIRPFVGKAIRPVLMDARVQAPGALGWSPVTGSVDGGGWWQWTVRGMLAYRPNHVRTLRAFATAVRGGERVIVPCIDDPQGLARGPENVPFNDGASFDDGALWRGESIEAHIESAVGLRADELIIVVRSGQELLGGDLFSLDRPEKGPELHVTSRVEYLGANRWRVRVGPNFRQDHAALTDCNFDTPAFTATIPDTSTLWPEYGVDWVGEAEVTFVEAP